MSTLCVNVFHAARGYLLISHARLSISAIATPQRSIYRPPTIAIAVRFFFLKRLVWPVILGDYWFEQAFIYHRFGIASHRSVSVSLRIELPPRNPGSSYWPLLIYYHVICYLFSRSTEALSISQQSEAAKGASKGLFSVGFALFEL